MASELAHDSCCGDEAAPAENQPSAAELRQWGWLTLVLMLYLSALVWVAARGQAVVPVVLGSGFEREAVGEGLAEVLIGLWLAAAEMLTELMPWWLLGMVIAAMMVGLSARPGIARRLRSGGIGASAVAMGAGAAVPICSCGMAPMAAGMTRSGVPLGPVMAFIIAAPMINVPALLLTGGALGPEYAAGRVVATLVLALLAAWIFARWARRLDDPGSLLKTGGESGGSCGASAAALSAGQATGANSGLVARAWGLFLQMNSYLLLAVAMGGAIKAMVPAAWIASSVGGDGPAGVVLAALAASVLYLCTYTEVPTAAALVELGMGPGATLSYLLAGPGMSLPSLLLLSAVFRLRALAAYAALALTVAVLAGVVFNFIVAA